MSQKLLEVFNLKKVHPSIHQKPQIALSVSMLNLLNSKLYNVQKLHFNSTINNCSTLNIEKNKDFEQLVFIYNGRYFICFYYILTIIIYFPIDNNNII